MSNLRKHAGRPGRKKHLGVRGACARCGKDRMLEPLLRFCKRCRRKPATEVANA